jgi:hypothetical protein
MMPFRKLFILISLLALTVCLIGGFTIAKQWAGIVAGFFSLLCWLLARKRSSPDLTSASLIVSIALASAGLFTGAPPLLMMLSAALTLACWDLLLFEYHLMNNPSNKWIALLEKKHFESLALAIGFGLLLEIIGLSIHITIPFVGMIILVGLLAFLLERVWHMLVE